MWELDLLYSMSFLFDRTCNTPRMFSQLVFHKWGAVMLVFQFVAILASTFFSGASIYINLVEHPAWIECGTSVAVTVFRPVYRRAAVMQVMLALLATGAGLAAWITGGSVLWLVGALLIFAVIPFTLVVIRPTNKQLLDTATDPASAQTQRLLLRWGRLHAVRSILALVSSVVFLVCVIGLPPGS